MLPTTHQSQNIFRITKKELLFLDFVSILIGERYDPRKCKKLHLTFHVKFALILTARPDEPVRVEIWGLISEATMQDRDSNSQLLYGLFQSICGWALEMGYKDVSGMKNLLKLAMVDVCRQQHSEKPGLAAQMAVVADLGISLRNVQYALKALDDVQTFSESYIKIRQIQEEITIILSQNPRTLDELLPEVTFLIHAPYELQRRTLCTILSDLEKKGALKVTNDHGRTVYAVADTHPTLFDPHDISSRVSGVLTHIDAFNHTLGEPYQATFRIRREDAAAFQTAVNDFLRGTGTAYEQECDQDDPRCHPFTFYLGGMTHSDNRIPLNTAQSMLEVIRERFSDPARPSIARTHWYYLTPDRALTVYKEVCDFISREGYSAALGLNEDETTTMTCYIGLADRQSDHQIKKEN
jgi:hypothetical protein